MAASDLKTWTVGDVKVTRVVERAPINSLVSMMFSDDTAELLKPYDWLRPHFISPEGEMLVAWQCFVVETPSLRIMVDTCIGNDRERHFDLFSHMQTGFLDDLAAAGYPPETIDVVMCTHLHYDHVGWNTRLVDGKWVPTFPNARYLFGQVEWENILRLAAEGDWHAEHLPDALQPVVDAGLVTFVSNDHRLCDEVWFEPTPGHTPGHASVHIASQGAHAVITGDIMHHPVQFALPDKACNFDHDKHRACLTRRDFFKRYGDSDTLIVGSHFPEPTAGFIRSDTQEWRFDTSPQGSH